MTRQAIYRVYNSHDEYIFEGCLDATDKKKLTERGYKFYKTSSYVIGY